ncbi:MAG: SDR family NAD(P)-dependent oxidoreductase [Acidimicrobiales bacterium]
MQRFAGRRAVVTGASRGIGAAIAERLAAEGAAVVVTARTLDRHEHLAGSLTSTLARCRRYGTTVEAVVADLGDPASRAAIIPTASSLLGGPPDILVNNAAAAIYASTLDYPSRRAHLMFEVNVHAPTELAQTVIPAMVANAEGWIVNLSSATARPAAGPPFRTAGVATRIGVYGATKAALNRITNALAVELHGTGVRISTVEPRAAVMSEGAEALVGGTLSDDQIEPMECMVEAATHLCACGVEHNGRSLVSLDLIAEAGLEVMTLDGSSPCHWGPSR